MTSRTAAAVGPTSAIRFARLSSAWMRTHSAPVRVLPKPRPASSSQMRQSPAGVIWVGRPQKRQSNARAAASASGRAASTSSFSSSSSELSELASNELSSTLGGGTGALGFLLSFCEETEVPGECVEGLLLVMEFELQPLALDSRHDLRN